MNILMKMCYTSKFNFIQIKLIVIIEGFCTETSFETKTGVNSEMDCYSDYRR